MLGGTAYLANKPQARAAVRKGEAWVAKHARRVFPDAFPDDRVLLEAKHFATPASGLFNKVRAKVADALAPEAPLGRFRGVTKALRESGDKDAIKLARRRQQNAVRTLKKGATLAGAGALAGGGAMKLYADQPEDKKVHQGARLRNALVGAAAGSFLGGGLHTGTSGFRGARVGAALGGIMGALSNPKRKTAIEDLTSASFSSDPSDKSDKSDKSDCFTTPASRLLQFDDTATDAGWDVRDPRGRSARVFAPGSGKRVRRPKEWFEKADNERKLWKGAVVAGAVAAGAGGVAIGRHFPIKKKVAAAAEKILPIGVPFKKATGV